MLLYVFPLNELHCLIREYVFSYDTVYFQTCVVDFPARQVHATVATQNLFREEYKRVTESKGMVN